MRMCELRTLEAGDLSLLQPWVAVLCGLCLLRVAHTAQQPRQCAHIDGAYSVGHVWQRLTGRIGFARSPCFPSRDSTCCPFKKDTAILCGLSLGSLTWIRGQLPGLLISSPNLGFRLHGAEAGEKSLTEQSQEKQQTRIELGS